MGRERVQWSGLVLPDARAGLLEVRQEVHKAEALALAAFCLAGGHSVVPGPGGAAAVQLRHAGGPVERRLHLRRDVQETVSPSSFCPPPTRALAGTAGPAPSSHTANRLAAYDGSIFIYSKWGFVPGSFSPLISLPPPAGTCCQMRGQQLAYRAAAAPAAVAARVEILLFGSASISLWCNERTDEPRGPRRLRLLCHRGLISDAAPRGAAGGAARGGWCWRCWRR